MTDFYSRNDTNYSGDVYSIPFDYIDEQEVQVYIDNELWTQWHFTSKNQLTLDEVPEEISSKSIISIRRNTDITDKVVTYNNNSLLNMENLNKSQDQLLYAVQEIYDNNTQFSIDIRAEVDEKVERVSDAVEKLEFLEDSVEAASKAALEATEQAQIATEKAEETLNTYNEAMQEVDSLRQNSINEINNLVDDHTDDLNALDQQIKKDAEAIINRVGLNMFDTVLKDHILSYEESKGLALQGTYVYKTAIAGERYGYPDFYSKCLEEYENAQAQELEWIQPKINSNGIMGGDTFAVEASSFETNVGRQPYKSFDGNSSTKWGINNTRSGWLTFYNPIALKVSSIVYTPTTDFPTEDGGDLEILGSNDNSDWTSLWTGNYTGSSISTFNVNSQDYYKYYKISITNAIHNYSGLGDLTINATVLGDIRKNANGHVFYDISIKNQIDEIFNTTGSAWFYGIDEENERILLPADTDRYLITCKKPTDDNPFWYNLYSDGWCEQGDLVAYGSNWRTVVLRKKYSNTNYSLAGGACQQDASYAANPLSVAFKDKTTSSFMAAVHDDNSVNSGAFTWYACGYTQTPENVSYKYICVGNKVADTSWIDVVTQVKNGAKEIEDKKIQSLNDLNNKEKAGIAALANASNALRTTQITNCITEIPQNIKLELADGVLTLKAGSKVIVPNGFEADGTTPKFDYVTITSDISATNANTGGASFVYYTESYGKPSLVFSNTGSTISGASIQANYTIYNTSINKVNYLNSNIEVQDERSLPIAIVQRTGVISSIDQVFNGMGYIGSTVWVDKGVKALIPNGRNEDGSLKNIEFTTDGVWTCQTTYNCQNATIGIIPSLKIINYVTQNDVVFNDKENKNILVSNGNMWDGCFAGQLSVGNLKVTTFNPKQPFRAIDYNEFAEMQNSAIDYPDYTKGISKAWNTEHTADESGWLYGNGYAGETFWRLAVDGQVFELGTNYSATSRTGIMIPIKKGSKYKASGGNITTPYLIFYPLS